MDIKEARKKLRKTKQDDLAKANEIREFLRTIQANSNGKHLFPLRMNHLRVIENVDKATKQELVDIMRALQTNQMRRTNGNTTN